MGLGTISLAENNLERIERIERYSSLVKNIQLERLDDSLVNDSIETERPKTTTPKKPQAKVVPQEAIALVKEFEGFKNYAYIDTDGTPVIGYGLSRIAGKPVQIGDRIDVERAEVALHSHLEEIQHKLTEILEVDLSDRQLSALASISFNVGVDSIADSTLIRKINSGDHTGAANEFLRWDKADFGGRLVQMPGLTRRRAVERELFLQQNS